MSKIPAELGSAGQARRLPLHSAGQAGRPLLHGFFLNSLPCSFYVTMLGVGLTDAESKCEAVIQPGVRQVEIAGAVETIHQGLICGVASLQAEADKVQRRGRGQFETLVPAHPVRELLG